AWEKTFVSEFIPRPYSLQLASTALSKYRQSSPATTRKESFCFTTGSFSLTSCDLTSSKFLIDIRSPLIGQNEKG
ncbi:MAG: hypothetical protein J7J46_07120, partial [Candidatus Desulfofervidus sp.]|nr:hypothetical protein [Candidatus Desulfofervidus sp.]